MIIEMDKLEKKHYLKHYLGGPAMVLAPDYHQTGQLESLDLEDGSVCIKSGEKSSWSDDEHVTPSLKRFIELSLEDLKCIINNLRVNGQKLNSSLIVSINPLPKGFHVQLSNGFTILIDPYWNIYVHAGEDNLPLCVQNPGIIFFLLCEMGYDVTNYF